MIIEMGYLFNRKGATIPVELVERIDDEIGDVAFCRR